VLVDTTAARTAALAHALAAVQARLPGDVVARAVIGNATAVAVRSAADALRVVGRALDEVDVELMTLRADRAFDDAMSRVVELLPGARDAIAKLAERVRCIVVTRAPARVADRILSLAALDTLVSGIVAADDVAPKPAPVAHERALARLRRVGVTDPRAVVALEDAEPGIAAARAAGVCVVGVGRHAATASSGGPWLASVATLNYDALVELLEDRGARGP
jgi:beta-phosphoglucomutase